jgi:Transcriptional regulators
VEFPFPPAIGRLLDCAAKNPGVSSRELCEFLDLRPSSLSEMLSRAESEGLLTRTADEEDRRVQRVSLTEKGARLAGQMEDVRLADAAKKTSCLTEEEKKTFCELADRLSGHMERLALDLPEDCRPPRRGPGHGPEGPGERPDRRPRFPPEVRMKS